MLSCGRLLRSLRRVPLRLSCRRLLLRHLRRDSSALVSIPGPQVLVPAHTSTCLRARPQVFKVYSRRKGHIMEPVELDSLGVSDAVDQTESLLDSFKQTITRRTTALLAAPQPQKRRKKVVSADFKPRRSRRVAKLPPDLGNAVAAKVCRQLGLCDDQDSISLQDATKYAKLFEVPLSREHVAALAALFGWESALDGMCPASSRQWIDCCSVRSFLLHCILSMVSLNFLVWNVMGLNDRSKRDCVKSLVLSLKPSIVCLQEIKLSSVSVYDVLFILGAGFSNLVAWKDRMFASSCSFVKDFSVSVQFHEEHGPKWWFTGVYGPHQDNLKGLFCSTPIHMD